ncbi:hypothetical protein GCM10025768_10910 [Microbacterium pseudoresistens]|uniref:SAF domain-containing protein n=1 Tax=Microbacterium pseudoresistens TaxID=640634 RepID=A0A7Y9EWA3_9MICO|nr:SAF domain-containing protein [Microbacterium pseudoresistens]NYD54994.1 hypothetical protein [Microbacterium pseudoresistens]
MTIPRVSRRPWGDLRFLLGVCLIIASVLGVWMVVASARQTTSVLQAARTIVAGQALSSDDVRVVEVALGSITDDYLTPGTLEPGTVATRTIAAGELIPGSAGGDADDARTTSIVVDSAIGIPGAITDGAVVEVWVAPALPDGKGFEQPRILIPSATVADVTHDDSMLGGAQASLELVIDRAQVGDVLSAVTGGASLSVVPAGGRS